MTEAQCIVARPREPGDDDALLAGFVDAFNQAAVERRVNPAAAAAYLGETPRNAQISDHRCRCGFPVRRRRLLPRAEGTSQSSTQ